MWKYCDSIFQLGFFYFLYCLSFFHFIFTHTHFISFFFFLFFSSTQVSSVHSYLYPPFFYFLSHLKNIPANTFTSHQRERERERDCCLFAAPPLVEIEVAERTKLVEISVHHATLPCSLPHCRSSSSPSPSWVRLTCSFFFFFFLFACSDSILF